MISDFQFINIVQNGDRVFVTYEGRGKAGRRFRNTEILSVRGAKIVDAEVYFGWTIPHERRPAAVSNRARSPFCLARIYQLIEW